MSKEEMKTFECIEHGERFLLDALSIEDARAKAEIYGAEVIGEFHRVNEGQNTKSYE